MLEDCDGVAKILRKKKHAHKAWSHSPSLLVLFYLTPPTLSRNVCLPTYSISQCLSTLSRNVCLLCLAMSVYSVSQCLSVPGIPAVQWHAAVIMLSTLKIG
jgi:hypothetical protein